MASSRPGSDPGVPAGTDLTGVTAIVTGASRGFGRGIATALIAAGARVTGVARDHDKLAQVRAELGEAFTPVTADATDPVVAGQLIDAYRPGILVLNAGASPLPRPIQQHTWQSFSRNWEVDVQHAFHWTREALLAPLRPGSTVVTISSGAAVAGSPLSGGYAGAKSTIRFITAYAAAESERGELGIRFATVLPQLTPATELGAAAVAAYAARQGTDVSSYLQNAGPALTPARVGEAIAELIASPAQGQDAYLLTAAGLRPLS
jgi:NAD(P)-dependent dehydrogenase (short-subunit alcohol dehydrogenase family)